jgi:hypothetical protein
MKTYDEIAMDMDRLADRLRHGCGSTHCRINPGSSSNDQCRCHPAYFVSKLELIGAQITALQMKAAQ